MQVEQHSPTESSSEDENGQLINDKVQSRFLNVLARIRAKDPTLYKNKTDLFNEADFETQQKPQQNDKKKYTYKDMQRQQLLQNGKIDEQGIEEDAMTPHDLQNHLKSQFKKVAQKAQQEDTLLKVKSKQKDEPTTKNLQNYAKNEKQKQILQRFWGDDNKLDETDLFLKRYILSKGWVDKDPKSKFSKKIEKQDVQRDEQMEQYEQKYNFRFEQPGGAFIQTFPRRISQSLRMKKETRKEKRAKKKQQKKHKLEQLQRQTQKMKEAKKEEIAQRIAQLNNTHVEVETPDQNPISWFFCDDCQSGIQEDQPYYVCQQCPNYTLCQQCYELIIHPHSLKQQIVPEGCGAPSEEEVRRALSELLRCRKCKTMIDDYAKRYELVDPNDGFTYHYCEECQDLLPLTLRKRCKQVKQQKVNLQEVLENDPEKLKQFVEDDQVDKLLRQYIGLDYNKVIADGMKTKFKYIDVKPESYGLSDEQILYSDDKQLNKYVSIKKLVPYCQENMRLRNTVYNKKIKTISRSARRNKNSVENNNEMASRKMKLLRDRAEKRKQKSISGLKKMKLLDLSQKESEAKHFIPKSRLQSYGIE